VIVVKATKLVLLLVILVIVEGTATATIVKDNQLDKKLENLREVLKNKKLTGEQVEKSSR
jgi:hypothetical protein